MVGTRRILPLCAVLLAACSGSESREASVPTIAGTPRLASVAGTPDWLARGAVLTLEDLDAAEAAPAPEAGPIARQEVPSRDARAAAPASAAAPSSLRSLPASSVPPPSLPADVVDALRLDPAFAAHEAREQLMLGFEQDDDPLAIVLEATSVIDESSLPGALAPVPAAPADLLY